MTYWTVTADTGRSTPGDKVHIAKQVFLRLKQHKDGGLREAAHFGKDGQPLELTSPATVIAVCDFLHSYGLKFQLHEARRLDFDFFRAGHQTPKRATVAAG